MATAKVKVALFSELSEQTLLSYGIPVEWIEDVRKADEDYILDLAGCLPKLSVPRYGRSWKDC